VLQRDDRLDGFVFEGTASIFDILPIATAPTGMTR